MMMNETIQSRLSLLYLYLYLLVTAVSTRAGDCVSSTDEKKPQRMEANDGGVSNVAKIYSNQYGLIIVSVQIEIEEETMIPFPLSSDKHDDIYSGKHMREWVPFSNTSEIQNSNANAPLQRNADLRWTLYIEEIQMEENESISSPFSHGVRFQWNRTNEANEYVVGKDLDDTNTNATTSKGLFRNLMHYSGTANFRFMIPLQSDDAFSHASPASQSSPSLSRTFIVSLMQSTGMALYNDTQHDTYRNREKKNNHNRRINNTILTRRLATLPRENNSYSQRTVNPVANVFLHHSQRMTHHEVSRLSGSNSLESYHSFSSNTERPTAGDVGATGNMESHYTSEMTLRTVANDENGFLWSLILLCVIYLIQSMPVHHLRNVKLLGYVKSFHHVEEYEVSECQDNTSHQNYKTGEGYVNSERFGDKNSTSTTSSSGENDANYCQLHVQYHNGEIVGENIVEEVCTDKNECSHQGGSDHHDHHDYNQESKETKVKETEARIIPHDSKKNHLYSEDSGKGLSLENDESFGNGRQPSSRNANLEKNQASCSIHGVAVEKERNFDKSKDNVIEIVDNSRILHEDASPENDITRLRLRDELKVFSRNMSRFSDDFLMVSKPDFEITEGSRGASTKLHPERGSTCIEIATDERRKSSNVWNQIISPKENLKLMNTDSETKHDGWRLSISGKTDTKGGPDRCLGQLQNPSKDSVTKVACEHHEANVLVSRGIPPERLTITERQMQHAISSDDVHEQVAHKDNKSVGSLLQYDHPLVSFHKIGLGRRQSASITLEKLDGMKKKGNGIRDFYRDTHSTKSVSNEPTIHVRKNPAQFSKNNFCPKTKRAIIDAKEVSQVDINLRDAGHNDHNRTKNGCPSIGGHKDDANNGSKIDDCGTRCEAITSIGAKGSPAEKKKLDSSDEDLWKKSEVEQNSISEHHNRHASCKISDSADVEEGMPKQSKLIQRCTKNGNQDKCDSQEIQDYETEESYVSTLPPDSDYLSDENSVLLVSSCQGSTELQAVDSQSIKSSRKFLLQKSSPNTSVCKRKKRSPHIYSIGMSDRKLQKGLQKEDDLDSVEVLRVVIPDRSEKKVKRPYSKSNYVADWVPSNELQSMSHHFLKEDQSWDIAFASQRMPFSSLAAKSHKESMVPHQSRNEKRNFRSCSSLPPFLSGKKKRSRCRR